MVLADLRRVYYLRGLLPVPKGAYSWSFQYDDHPVVEEFYLGNGPLGFPLFGGYHYISG